MLQPDTVDLILFFYGKENMCVTILCMESGFALLSNNYYREGRKERVQVFTLFVLLMSVFKQEREEKENGQFLWLSSEIFSKKSLRLCAVSQ